MGLVGKIETGGNGRAEEEGSCRAGENEKQSRPSSVREHGHSLTEGLSPPDSTDTL